MSAPVLSDQIDAVRRFSRLYTRRIGVLHEGLLGSPFPLTEARIIYELAQAPATTAKELAALLELDAGYLSRILKRFAARGLIVRQAALDDGRRYELSLTAAGRAAFVEMNAQSKREVGDLLAGLAQRDRRRLVAALETVEGLLDPKPAKRETFILRPHQPGDIGWVIARHGQLYAEEYGWDETFEAFVAEIAAKFILEFDAKRERCWVAERDGETVGAVFLVRQSEEVAKLRMLIVAPEGRGLGIGKRLVEECIRFARRKGYCKITLWTNDILTAARAIYVATGFQLTAREEHHSFGQDLVGETWELTL